MSPLDLSTLIGEWFGLGTMTIGTLQGTIQEYVRLETTDRTDCLSYVRHSRIRIGGQSALHNELGYMRRSDVSLLLSRGSYVILPWDTSLGAYRQAAGSPDTRNMTRKVTVSAGGEMTWDSAMEVQEGGAWVRHAILTPFTSLSLLVSTAQTPNQVLRLMPVSFAKDILPLFRAIDIQHMARRGVHLDQFAYMSDPAGDATYPDHAHARAAYCYLTGDCTPQMPPGGPFWSAAQLQLFSQWMADGFQA